MYTLTINTLAGDKTIQLSSEDIFHLRNIHSLMYNKSEYSVSITSISFVVDTTDGSRVSLKLTKDKTLIMDNFKLEVPCKKFIPWLHSFCTDSKMDAPNMELTDTMVYSAVDADSRLLLGFSARELVAIHSILYMFDTNMCMQPVVLQTIGLLDCKQYVTTQILLNEYISNIYSYDNKMTLLFKEVGDDLAEWVQRKFKKLKALVTR